MAEWWETGGICSWALKGEKSYKQSKTYEKYEFFGANHSINNCFGLGKNVLNEKSALEAFSEW